MLTAKTSKHRQRYLHSHCWHCRSLSEAQCLNLSSKVLFPFTMTIDPQPAQFHIFKTCKAALLTAPTMYTSLPSAMSAPEKVIPDSFSGPLSCPCNKAESHTPFPYAHYVCVCLRSCFLVKFSRGNALELLTYLALAIRSRVQRHVEIRIRHRPTIQQQSSRTSRTRATPANMGGPYSILSEGHSNDRL